VIRIEDTKNNEPRTLPFKALPELAAIIRNQWERAKAIEMATGRIISRVFFRSRRSAHLRLSEGLGHGLSGCGRAGAARP
jgi:hypothetical protein